MGVLSLLEGAAMKKSRVLQVVLSFFLLVALSGLLVAFCAHEKWQCQQIYDLQRQIASLKNNDASPVEYDADAFNYLAIGNSITLHGKCNYWWNESGMAASVPEKDYFHLVADYLREEHNKVISYPYNFSVWEIQSTDRTQTTSNLTKYLSEDLDLISIQLSENAVNLDTFVVDLKELITILQEACPCANIILVDDFWSEEKSELKRQVAKELGISFASLDSIRGVEAYKREMGTTVYGDDNASHIVEHSGVAEHPGDEGMQAIADAIIAVLKETQ